MQTDRQWPQTCPQCHYRHAWLIDRGTERRFGCWRCGHFYALPRETPGREAPRHPASETFPPYQRGLGFGCRFTSDARVFVEEVVTYRTVGEMVRLARRWQEDPLTDVDRSYLTWAFGEEVYFVLGDESRIPTEAMGQEAAIVDEPGAWTSREHGEPGEEAPAPLSNVSPCPSRPTRITSR